MKIRCNRCGITCWHYNDRCMACGCLMTKIIEMPGLFYVYMDGQSMRFATAFNAESPIISDNLIYHAIFTDRLRIKFISEEYKNMLAGGEWENEGETYALLQSN